MGKKERKGKFSSAGLRVAGAYPEKLSRRGMVLLGLTGVALVLGMVVIFQLLRGGGWATQGPLSSAHAAFGADCGNCHSPGERAVTDERCSTCHEKFGDKLGVYTHAAHFIYRSDDFRRLAEQEEPQECSSCHIEHQGRHAEITRVPDTRCQSCHFDSFRSDHPEFEFAAKAIADSATVSFPHIHHVREVMKREALEDTERACLYCHNAQPEGKSFEPISFDRHCDACHLTTTTATDGLLVAIDGDPTPGVETLEQIAQQGGPAARWAYFTNPNEFRRRGSAVVKAPVHHLDPWILSNLRRLRGLLYRDAGVADLLRASPEAPAYEIRELYEEAIATLEEQAIGLRGRPEPAIQSELRRIDEILESLSRDITDPYAPLDETEFLLALEQPNDELAPEERTAIEELIEGLTRPCQQCHLVEAATIARVQKDQRVLRRAEFDHRAHIVQARCLDCHTGIPILEQLGQETPQDTEIDTAVDNAAIQNVPTIQSCRECHTPKLASDRCVTCHLFHPNKSRRSELLLYLGEEPAGPALLDEVVQ